MSSANPRNFCQASGYRSTLILTWSFDAVFFERLVHHDLRHGGSGTQLVVADASQIAASAQSWAGRLQKLGRSYLLEPADVSGHFHPKVILRLGEKGGAIWISSGNVTPGGWGQQRELSSQWEFGPEHKDSGAWLPALLDQVRDWCASSQALEAIGRMREEAWIPAGKSLVLDAIPILLSAGDQSLATMLKARWEGRRFREVHILTGSTDKKGAFLRWAHDTFGIERAVISVDPSRASFLPVEIGHLPFPVEFVQPSHESALHAKYYWFEAGKDSGAVMGSPNCSYSAWLRPPSEGGNIECALVYDSPTRTAFEAIMEDFARARTSPDEHLLLGEPPTASPPPESPQYRLDQVELDSVRGALRARIQPVPVESA